MDSKTLRLAVLLSVTAAVLILLVVYAANAGKGRPAARTDAQEADGGAAVSADLGDADSGTEGDGLWPSAAGEGFRAYGEQIGNQPKAFLYDESFFDPMRDIGRGISEGDEEALTLQATAAEDTIHVSILNSRGGLESGVAFQVIAEQVQTGKEKTWTDADRDGQIDLMDQANGNYRLRLLEVQGYTVPSAPVVVKVDAAVQPEAAAETATGGQTGAGAATGGQTDAGTATSGQTDAGTAASGQTDAGTAASGQMAAEAATASDGNTAPDGAAAGEGSAAGMGDTEPGADRW